MEAEPAAEDIAQTRSELAVTAASYTLPYRGGYGGGFFNLDCPTGYVATGAYGRFGKYIDRLGLVCKELRADGSLGILYRTPPVGGSGGGDFSLGCPEGEAIVGLKGASGGYVDKLGLICSKPLDWLINTNTRYYTVQVGGAGGGTFEDVCNLYFVVTSLTVNAGGLVDAVQARCSRLN